MRNLKTLSYTLIIIGYTLSLHWLIIIGYMLLLMMHLA